jgi:hypothetical protein
MMLPDFQNRNKMLVFPHLYYPDFREADTG